MADLIISGFPQSSYVMTARFAAGEKGVAHTFVPFGPGDERQSKLHPYKKVPSMTHGSVHLFETSAITRYIDEGFDGPALQPGDPAGRARMEQWISVVNCYAYRNAVVDYILQYVFPRGADGAPNREVIDAALPKIEYDFGLFDAAYEKSEFIAGDKLSLADLFVAPLVFGAARFPEGEALLGKSPNLARAIGALTSRDAFKASMPAQ